MNVHIPIQSDRTSQYCRQLSSPKIKNLSHLLYRTNFHCDLTSTCAAVSNHHDPEANPSEKRFDNNQKNTEVRPNSQLILPCNASNRTIRQIFESHHIPSGGREHTQPIDCDRKSSTDFRNICFRICRCQPKFLASSHPYCANNL